MSRAERTRETWRDPEIRAARSKKNYSPEMREFMADLARKTWRDPAIRSARCAALAQPRGKGARAKDKDVVPKWVARSGLQITFLDEFFIRDEFSAAKLCRRILQARRGA